MNAEKQRITIAEFCGWEDIGWFVLREGKLEPNNGGSLYGWKTEPNDYRWQFKIPDYLNDLNAMHKAEDLLIFNDFGKYEQNLIDTIHKDYKSGLTPIAHPLWYATAAQRAEAFLRTIGKWEHNQTPATLGMPGNL